MKFLTSLFVVVAVGTTNAFLSDVSGIASQILEQVQNHISSIPSSNTEGRQYGGGGYGGCTDSFSVFGFLAFLLALLDLILDLQANMAGGTGGRKKRNSEDMEEMWNPTCQENAEIKQATSACYSLLRGFMNALASDESECAKRFMCEGAEEAATSGPLGEIIANVASLNAGSWLQKVNATKFADIAEAGQSGVKWRDCAFRYSNCYALPAAYRYPAVYRGPQLPSEAYQPVLEEMMDVVKSSILR